MKTITRIPHVPAAALPELDDFLRPFHVHFARAEGPRALERYLTGLLTEHPNKNCDTLAQVVPGTSEQRPPNKREAARLPRLPGLSPAPVAHGPAVRPFAVLDRREFSSYVLLPG